MPRALPLVATLIAVGSAWSAEPAPVRPLDWRPILPTTPAPAKAPAAAPAPAPATEPAPLVEPVAKADPLPGAPVADADASRFTPFNGLVIEPRVISAKDSSAVAGLGWNLDLSLIHNRLVAFIRGLPESDGNRTVAKDQLDLDVRVEGFGQFAANPDLNPADHESGRIGVSAGYGFVGSRGGANPFSDDASSLYLDAAVQAGIETNQNLNSSQYVVGVRLVATPSLGADLADLNVFDWIPRIGRFLSGDEWAGNGSGRALPTITLGLDHVIADSNDLRDAVAPDDSSYQRVHLAFAGRAPIWHLPASEQYLYGTLSMDFYQELSAPSGVTDADIDFDSFFRVGLELPHDLTVALNHGELPMAPTRETFWTVGWKLTL